MTIAAPNLRRVFEPIRIGAVEIPNRIARTAHATMLSRAGVNDELIAYHEARAKGGAGLTILEAAAVHPTTALGLRVDDDAYIDGYRQLMKAVRPHGMRVFQQLWHGGSLYFGPRGETPFAPSTIPSAGTGVVGRPMAHADIEEIVAAFAAAARRCEEGGIEGAEVHGAHGYIVHQFLSPLTNKRDDEYGGSLENRMRFLRKILTVIRATVSSSFALGVRLSASTAPGGLGEEDLSAVARVLEADGLIDYLNTSWGDYYEPNRSSGALDCPTGYELPSSSQITAAVRVPRIVAGRYRTLEEADQALGDGVADLVSMVRAQIADPDLVRKTREGRALEVRPCIGCNQGCLGGLIRVGRLGCTVNPAIGAERALAEGLIKRTPQPKKVVIVGGGPAGLEAARVAAHGGHNVVLFEASPRLGGAVHAARQAPFAHGLADYHLWAADEIARLGVAIRTGVYAGREEIEAEAPDAIVVATGSLPRLDGLQIAIPGHAVEGVDLPHVFSSHDVLTNTSIALGESALVLDDTGHIEALSVAEFLQSKGVAVTFVTRHGVPAPSWANLGRIDPMLRRLYRGAFRILPRYALVEIKPKVSTVRLLLSDRTESVDADTVVLVTPNEPVRDLYDALRFGAIPIHLVGDALSPRDMQAAIREGHLAARSLWVE